MKHRITILGAGESGIGAALLAQSKGLEPFVSDFGEIKLERKKILTDGGIPFEEGGHSEIVLTAQEIVKSPGIPDTAEIVVAARNAGIPVIDELELAFRYTDAAIIGITGTNGKTTTTLLTYHILKESGLNVGLAGNVGHSLAKQVIDNHHDYYVVEISSFQLDGLKDFKVDFAILLNITPDHLDRYGGSFDRYAQSKFRITEHQTPEDGMVYWKEDAVLSEFIMNGGSKARLLPITLDESIPIGAFQKGSSLVISGNHQFDLSQDDLPLIGKHNMLNIMASVLAADFVGIRPGDIVKNLRTFRNAPHRLEKVANIDGVTFVNDSKATNVNAAYYALDGLDGDIIWIAGGIDKGNDYSLLGNLASEKVKAIICLGRDNQSIIEFFNDKVSNISETTDVQDAVRLGYELADSKATVLLSPACASFDLFNNYEHRGDRFKEEVMRLKSTNGHKKEVTL